MKPTNRAKRFFQAYANTPWRRQVQFIGLFSAFVVVIALAASAYLWVTSMAATYGRQIQEIQATADVVDDNIEDLNTRLGEVTTTERMQELAEEQGYQHMTTGSLEYLVVSGYPEEQPLDLVSAESENSVEPGQELPPEFTKSLIDWLRDYLYRISLETGASESGGGN